MGITDPEIFELLGLFEKDFGPDRLSDMTIAIILDDLFQYSARITKSLKLKKLKTVSTIYGTYKLPMGPIQRTDRFRPQQDIAPLPVAQSWDEIGDVVWFNQALRHRLNGIISKYWKKGMKVLKEKLRETPILLSIHPRYLAVSKPLINSFKNTTAGKSSLHESGRRAEYPLRMCTQHRLPLQRDSLPLDRRPRCSSRFQRDLLPPGE